MFVQSFLKMYGTKTDRMENKGTHRLKVLGGDFSHSSLSS